MKKTLKGILILVGYFLGIVAFTIYLRKPHDCLCPQVAQVIDSTYFPHSSHFASITTQIHVGKKVLWKKFSYVEMHSVDSVCDANYQEAENALIYIENQ